MRRAMHIRLRSHSARPDGGSPRRAARAVFEWAWRPRFHASTVSQMRRSEVWTSDAFAPTRLEERTGLDWTPLPPPSLHHVVFSRRELFIREARKAPKLREAPFRLSPYTKCAAALIVLSLLAVTCQGTVAFFFVSRRWWGHAGRQGAGCALARFPRRP